MRVIPGSQTSGFSDYVSVDTETNTFDTEIEAVDETDAVYFELEPGQYSLHDGRIIHGAAPNRSHIRRTGYTMRYFSASVKVLPIDRNAGHRLWLARGKDRAGNTYQNR